MPIDRVETLLEALEESQLLSAGQLAECRRGLSGFADTRALARHLLQRDWLTPFQVNHVMQGKAGELFLDNYVLMERVGQGGMGQVFRAKHRIMDRVVALKIIRPERLGNPDLVKRFHREIKLAAQLTHPNIVAAYDADEVRGTHFLVMEFVEGIDLARHVEKNGPRPVPQACDWVRQVALGLQHAHERGMVHRDIKPANLLLAVKENVVKVLDMGLARISHGADVDQTAGGLTQEGTVMGTPDYMAPEQAEESTAVDIRADIYSLGCTLYFLLAGQAPFAGGTLAQKLRKHAVAEPEPLTARRGDVPAGLAAVVRKMMAKRPADRYQTPGEVAAALEVFCRAGPVVAVPVAAARPVAVPLSAESLAALGTLPASADGSAQAVETIPPSVLDSVPSVTLRQPPLARARGAWDRLGRRGRVVAGGAAGVLLLALLVVIVSRKSPPPPKPPEGPKSVLDGLDPAKIPAEEHPAWQSEALRGAIVAVLGEHRVRVASFGGMALSPDRNTVAVIDGAAVRLVDTKTLHEVRELAKHTQAVLCVAYSPDGKFVATGGADKMARLWNAQTGEVVAEIEPAVAVRAVAVTPGGKEVLFSGDERVIVWDVAKKDRKAAFEGHKSPVRALVVSADGRLAFSAAGADQVGKDLDKDVHVWNVATGKAEQAGGKDRVLTGHPGFVNRLELSADGKRLLGGTDNREVPVWRVGDGTDQLRLLTPSDATAAAGDGTLIGEDRAVTCVNAKVRPFVPDGRDGGYHDLDPLPVSPTYNRLAWLPAVPRDGGGTSSGLLYVAEGTLHVWDLDRKKEYWPPLGHTQPARWLTFLGDGGRLVSAGDDRTVRFWDLTDLYDPATGRPRESRPTLYAPPVGSATPIGASVSADGNLALTFGVSESFVTVWVWENGKWNPVRKLEVKGAGPSETVSSVSLSADGTRALTTATDKVLRLWDVKRPDQPKKVAELPNQNTVVRLLPEEDRATTWDGAELRLWEGIGGDKPQFVAVAARGTALAVAPGREMAIVGEGDGHMARLTELAKGRPLILNLDWWQSGAVTALALAPDRTAFLAGSAGDGKIQGPKLGLWDLTKDPIPEPQTWDLRGAPTAISYAPEGRYAAVANADGTIYIVRLAH